MFPINEYNWSDRLRLRHIHRPSQRTPELSYSLVCSDSWGQTSFALGHHSQRSVFGWRNDQTYDEVGLKKNKEDQNIPALDQVWGWGSEFSKQIQKKSKRVQWFIGEYSNQHWQSHIYSDRESHPERRDKVQDQADGNTDGKTNDRHVVILLCTSQWSSQFKHH